MTLFYTVSGLRVKMIVKFWMLATREEKKSQISLKQFALGEIVIKNFLRKKL